MSFVQSAGGDYGALRLARGEFVAALDAFYRWPCGSMPPTSPRTC